VLFVEATK